MGGRPTEDLTEIETSGLSVISKTDSVSTGVDRHRGPSGVLVEEDPLTCECPFNQQER